MERIIKNNLFFNFIVYTKIIQKNYGNQNVVVNKTAILDDKKRMVSSDMFLKRSFLMALLSADGALKHRIFAAL